MLSCILKVKEGLRIETESDLVRAHREKAFKKLLEMAPDSQRIRDMAREFNVNVPARPNGCIRCRLCVRVCNDVVGAHAIKMVKTESGARVMPGEGDCIGCGTCANLCPTKVMQVQDEENIRTVSIQGEVISRLPLERCEACGNLYATSRFLDHVARNTAPHPDTKIHHHLCTACSKLMSDRAVSEKERIKK
jgi:predicted molibdopterin-dependent oxidoreductase YjgC